MRPTGRIVDRGARVLSYPEVVAGARAHFIVRSTVVMDDLAGELGVSRATLYRLIDGRDRLLGDVIWTLTAPLLGRLERRAATIESPGTMADLLVLLSLEFYESVLQPGPFQRFLEVEPETAMRVLLTPSGGVHERAVAGQRRLFRAACARLEEPVPADVDDLAYLYVRIIESLLYADLIIGRQPDLALVAQAARAILTDR